MSPLVTREIFIL